MKTLLVLTSLLLSVASTVPVMASDHAQDEQAIKQVTQDFTAAWNKHDAKAMTDFWAADGDLINPSGRVAKGHEEIEKLFADEQGGPMKTTTASMTVESTRFLSDDIAVVDAHHELKGMRGPGGKFMPKMSHHVFVVVVKKDGKWQIEDARPYTFLPPPPAAAKKGT